MTLEKRFTLIVEFLRFDNFYLTCLAIGSLFDPSSLVIGGNL